MAKKILILSANPINTARLRLDEEVKEIQARLERSRYRDQFEIVTRWAVGPDDLRCSLLDHEPQIVHFSGHGHGVDGLALEGNDGKFQLVSTSSLERLFSLFQGKIACVLLNACYSEPQAEAIFHSVDCVMGMNREIGDRAAIEFAIGFYDALGAGKSYENAYKFGCSAIDLQGIPEFTTPVLKSRRRSDVEDNRELEPSDMDILKDLLRRSGSASSLGREDLCNTIGIGLNFSPENLILVNDDIFINKLFLHLENTGKITAFYKICQKIEPYFKGGIYENKLQNIKSKFSS